MSKPTKSRHRIPTGYVVASDPISDRYAAEVEIHTTRLERAFVNAQKRLDAARAKAEIVAVAGSAPRVAAAWREVAVREAELAEIARLMQPGDTAPARNRGRKSFHPVPTARSTR